MILQYEEREAIVKYRMKKANEMIVVAEGNAKMQFWNTAANRLYYACFYAASALLLHNNFEANTHKGVNVMLNLNFVAKGLLPKEKGTFYGQIFSLRQTGDYDDSFDLTENEVLPLFEPAKDFIKDIENLLTKND